MEPYFYRNFPNVDLHQFTNKKQKPETWEQSALWKSVSNGFASCGVEEKT